MTSTHPKTLVIAAHGTVGTLLVQRLLEKGHHIRAATRTPHGGAPAGVEAVTLDPFDAESRRRAFEGVDRAFLLSPAGYADQHALLSPLVEEAVRASAKQVVLMTAMGVEHDESLPFRRLERQLEGSGLQYGILRPNWFMQNFASYWLKDVQTKNALLLPAAAARVSFVDVRDIADVAATLLDRPELPNRAWTLTGPEALTHEEAAVLLSRATNRSITYENTAPEVFARNATEAGLPADYIQLLVALFEIVRAGHYAPVTNDVAAVLGRPARALDDYVREFAATWKK